MNQFRAMTGPTAPMDCPDCKGSGFTTGKSTGPEPIQRVVECTHPNYQHPITAEMVDTLRRAAEITDSEPQKNRFESWATRAAEAANGQYTVSPQQRQQLTNAIADARILADIHDGHTPCAVVESQS